MCKILKKIYLLIDDKRKFLLVSFEFGAEFVTLLAPPLLRPQDVEQVFVEGGNDIT